MKRRTFLATTGSLATLAVAGCLDGDETADDSTTDPDTGSPTDSPTDTPTDSPTDTPTERPTDTPTDTPSRPLRNASFESGLEGWTVGKDLPEDPNNSGEPVDSDVRTTTELSADGETALAIEIDGSADDGTVWVQQEVDLTDVEALSVAGYSDQESFNEILQVATYAGPIPEDGLAEADFDRSNQLADHEGWKTYEYPVEHDGEGLIAVGLNIVWETTAVGVLDDVRLE
ncbi:hypothetical protein Huta_1527 [Halorhabdus utahensis DSM 12940]|uniref:Lipoprotein n=1 Tax=Halorhabdus utahensis (strain DSM 12940 / JCM 11049 / AX-2) TaxID=519442 RepID=C7NPB5_HALUD|nr:PT domain-containing protein [Halorhabdus utahensis]ACV11702.1 hypothetical protein Huta_1527 [Halorhabdus utahensis DSM 12940]